MDEKKLQPQYPPKRRQITSNMKWCQYTDQTEVHTKCVSQTNSRDRCACCGVGTEDFIQTTLLKLRADTNHTVALVERVECPEFVNSEIPLEEENAKALGYFRHEASGKWYHFFQTRILDNDSNICMIRRKNDNDYNMSCYQCDMQHVHEAFEKHDKDDMESFKLNEKYGFRYLMYTCEKTGFSEFIVPIYSDNAKKNVMAMLIFGQIVIGNDGVNALLDSKYTHRLTEDDIEEFRKLSKMDSKSLLKQQENDRDKKTGIKYAIRYYRSLNDMFDGLGETIGVYVKQMLDRAKHTTKEYLYDLQIYLLDEFQKAENSNRPANGKGLRAHIEELFKKLASRFALKRCLLFIPDFSLIINELQTRYYAIFVKGDNDSKAVTLNITKLPKPFSGTIPYDELTNLGCMTGYPEIEKEDHIMFYISNDENHFIAVLLEWEENETTDTDEKPPLDSFFASLLTLCRARIVEWVATVRKKRVDEFSMDFRHDISQMMFTFNEANNAFLKFLQSNILTVVPIEECRKYLSQMKSFYNTLDYFRTTIDSNQLLETPKYEQFRPWRKLEDLWRKIDNEFYSHRRSRRLNVWFDERNTIPYMVADPVMIERIVSNLVDNAMKYAYDGTNVYLEYEYNDEYEEHIFRTINYCDGIPKKDCEAIFERGTRGEGTDYEEGWGIGLSVARKLAMLHGGDVMLKESENTDDEIMTERVSDYRVPLLPLAERFDPNNEESFRGFLQRIKTKSGDIDSLREILTILNSERNRLTTENKNTSWSAGSLGRTNLLNEIINNDFAKQTNSLAFFMLKMLYKRPTYRVVFEASIPHKNI